MNINKKVSKKSIIIVAGILLLVGIGAGAYFILQNNADRDTNRSVNDVDYGKATDEQIKTGEDIKDNSNPDDPNQVGSDKAPQPTPGENGNKAAAPVTITASVQNGNVIQVRTLISVMTDTGECVITFTQQSTTVVKKAPVQSLPNGTTCAGFNIPVSELGVGTWQYTVTFENETMKGSTASNITVVKV